MKLTLKMNENLRAIGEAAILILEPPTLVQSTVVQTSHAIGNRHERISAEVAIVCTLHKQAVPSQANLVAAGY